VLFEVMTDKIAIEVESYDAGILLGRYVEVGQVVPVNTVIAHIGEAGEKVEKPAIPSAAAPTEVKAETPAAAPVAPSTPVPPVTVAPVQAAQRALPADGFRGACHAGRP
jgi:pyruvate dehydrogenase E2 component (dihydrolipoamide acetyltransferase)